MRIRPAAVTWLRGEADFPCVAYWYAYPGDSGGLLLSISKNAGPRYSVSVGWEAQAAYISIINNGRTFKSLAAAKAYAVSATREMRILLAAQQKALKPLS